MKKLIRVVVAVTLSAALMVGMCLTASAAYKYPSAYWKLHDAWAQAREAEDSQQILSLAQQTYDLLTKDELCADICYNLEPKSALASWLCEIKGDIDGAIVWQERNVVFAQWLAQNIGGYHDILINADARLDYLHAAKENKIYALTDQHGLSYPDSGAPVSGTWYGTPATAYETKGSAVLMYINFNDGYSVDYWINFYKNTSKKFKEATKGGVIELAWNFMPESTAGAQAVLDVKESYITDGLAAMGKLDATILLRVGAEMNCWGECDPDVFIRAFQRVAREARKYDNIKMVFSPTDANNRNVTAEDFYPGDEYVDWIGVSTYHNTNYSGQAPEYTFGAVGYGNDAYYGQGVYDSDPLVILRPLIRLAQEHGKPMMISECGFRYRDPATGADQTDFAADQLNKFYSYVNMIYPQVKAVFYFDVTLSGGNPYTLTDNSTILSTYRNAIAANGTYLEPGQTTAKTWQELSNTRVDAETESLKLAAYAPLPNGKQVTVRYYVDGKLAATSTEAPYYFTLDVAGMGGGKHTVYTVATGGQFKVQSPTYTITIPDRPVKQEPDLWAKPFVDRAEAAGLITGRTRDVYLDQITRLQFAELAVNLIEQVTGKTVVPGASKFSDTNDPVVLKAVAAGVTSGTSDTTFSPDSKITREQICVMLNAVIRYVDGERGGQTLTNTSTQLNPKFVDAAQVADWAVPYVALLTNNDLMSGKTMADGSLGVAPKANTTVQEAIVLILAQYDLF